MNSIVIKERIPSQPVGKIECRVPTLLKYSPSASSNSSATLAGSCKQVNAMNASNIISSSKTSNESQMNSRSNADIASTRLAIGRVDAGPSISSSSSSDYGSGNDAMINAMSPKELSDALAEISSMLSPENIAFLKSTSTGQEAQNKSIFSSRVESNSSGSSTNLTEAVSSLALPSFPVPVPTPTMPSMFPLKSNRFDLEGRRIVIMNPPVEASTSTSDDSCRLFLDLESDLFRDSMKVDSKHTVSGVNVVHVLRQLTAEARKSCVQCIIDQSQGWVTRGYILDPESGGYLPAAGGGAGIAPCGVFASDERELYNHERDPLYPGYSFQDICEVSPQRMLACRMMVGIMWRRDFITSLEAYYSSMCALSDVEMHDYLQYVDDGIKGEMLVMMSNVHTMMQHMLSHIPADEAGSTVLQSQLLRLLCTALSKHVCACDLPVELPTLILWSVGQISPSVKSAYHTVWPLPCKLLVCQCLKHYIGSCLEESAAVSINCSKLDAHCFLGVHGSPALPTGPHHMRTAVGYSRALRDALDKYDGLREQERLAEDEPVTGPASNTTMMEQFAGYCRCARIYTLCQQTEMLQWLSTLFADCASLFSEYCSLPAADSVGLALHVQLAIVILEIFTIIVRNCEEYSEYYDDLPESCTSTNVIVQQIWKFVERHLRVIVSYASCPLLLMQQLHLQWHLLVLESCRRAFMDDTLSNKPSDDGTLLLWCVTNIVPNCIVKHAQSTGVVALRVFRVIVKQLDSCCHRDIASLVLSLNIPALAEHITRSQQLHASTNDETDKMPDAYDGGNLELLNVMNEVLILLCNYFHCAPQLQQESRINFVTIAEQLLVLVRLASNIIHDAILALPAVADTNICWSTLVYTMYSQSVDLDIHHATRVRGEQSVVDTLKSLTAGLAGDLVEGVGDCVRQQVLGDARALIVVLEQHRLLFQSRLPTLMQGCSGVLCDRSNDRNAHLFGHLLQLETVLSGLGENKLQLATSQQLELRLSCYAYIDSSIQHHRMHAASVAQGLMAHQWSLLQQWCWLLVLSVINLLDANLRSPLHPQFIASMASVMCELDEPFAYHVFCLSRIVIQQYMREANQDQTEFAELYHQIGFNQYMHSGLLAVSQSHCYCHRKLYSDILFPLCYVHNAGIYPAPALQSAAKLLHKPLPCAGHWQYQLLLFITNIQPKNETTPLSIMMQWLHTLHAVERSVDLAVGAVSWVDKLYVMLQITTAPYNSIWDLGVYEQDAGVSEGAVWTAYHQLSMQVFRSACVLRLQSKLLSQSFRLEGSVILGTKLLHAAPCEELVHTLIDAATNQSIDISINVDTDEDCMHENMHSFSLLVFLSEVLFPHTAEAAANSSCVHNRSYWKIRNCIWREIGESRLLHLLESHRLFSTSLVFLLPVPYLALGRCIPFSLLCTESSASACHLARTVVHALNILRDPHRDCSMDIYMFGAFLVSYALLTTTDVKSGLMIEGVPARLLADLLNADSELRLSDAVVRDVVVMMHIIMVQMPSIMSTWASTNGGADTSPDGATDVSMRILRCWAETLQQHRQPGGCIDTLQILDAVSMQSQSLRTLLLSHRSSLLQQPA